MELPLHERARLAERLLASLDQETAVEEAWAAEVELRVQAYRAGRLATPFGDEVPADARARLERR
jgi:putative addiction module component (TIGR02574 family)